MEAKNIDDQIIRAMSEQSSKPQEMAPPVATQENTALVDPKPEVNQEQSPQDPKELNDPYNVPHGTLETKNESQPEVKTSEPIDEYGNPVEKPKVYTEDEVQRMIRERLSRGRHSDSTSNQSSAPKATEAPVEGGEEWEQQLKSFVKNTVKEMTESEKNDQWQREQQIKHMEFEEKFTSGMRKYQDFDRVVSGKPITDSMMIATKSLDNPAAFIYAAAKMHPQEIDRISRIPDPFAQAAEVGRLHEKMIKQQKVKSDAPRHLEAPKGDMPNKAIQQPSLEERIAHHAKQKRAR